MGKEILIEPTIIKQIFDDSNTESIRTLSKKYNLNKNVILRILKNKNILNTDIKNIKYLKCKETKKIFYDIKNKSGAIRKHLESLNIKFDNKTYLNHFNLIYDVTNFTDFYHYLKSLRIGFQQKNIINGISKFHFIKEDIHIFLIDISIISENLKIKPIFLSKLNDRYDSSLFFYSDEWIHKKNIVKSKIEYVLKTHTKSKIFARKCNINEITTKEKNQFLDKNHIQGGCKSILNYGAFYNSKLIAVMCFSTNRSLSNDNTEFDYELIRFSTDINHYVIGICSKLLSFFIKKNGNNKLILSFGDKRFLLNKRNNIYNKLGFTQTSTSKHDFHYVDQITKLRKHKFGVQLRDKINNTNEKNTHKKIWDCGKYKFTTRT